jgi:hypothetical protein
MDAALSYPRSPVGQGFHQVLRQNWWFLINKKHGFGNKNLDF